MRRQDWFLRSMLALLVVGLWAAVLRPLAAPTPGQAATRWVARVDEVRAKVERASRA